VRGREGGREGGREVIVHYGGRTEGAGGGGGRRGNKGGREGGYVKEREEANEGGVCKITKDEKALILKLKITRELCPFLLLLSPPPPPPPLLRQICMHGRTYL
jgi:hypothetical protein